MVVGSDEQIRKQVVLVLHSEDLLIITYLKTGVGEVSKTTLAKFTHRFVTTVAVSAITSDSEAVSLKQTGRSVPSFWFLHKNPYYFNSSQKTWISFDTL